MVVAAGKTREAHREERIPIFDSWVRAWAPRERMSVSQWAARFRVLEEGAEPGPYRNDRTPYLVEPMDSFNHPRVATIVLIKSSRVGGTEAANNMVGFAIDQEPGDILYVYPRESDAKEECKKRLAPMITASPRLQEHIPAGCEDSFATKIEINLDSCDLYMAWAGSSSTLIRRTCRYAINDEADNSDPPDVKALGDAVTLSMDRLTTWKDQAKCVVTTSPSTPEKPGYRLFEDSDRRRYHVPCPHCGLYQVLVFDNLKVERRSDEATKRRSDEATKRRSDAGVEARGERRPSADEILEHDLAYYECAGCGHHIKEAEKNWMVLRGVWVPQCQEVAEKLPLKKPAIVRRAVFNSPERWTPRLDGTPPIGRIRGYHIWSAYSPWRSFSLIMWKWFKVQGKPMELRVFFNSWLGEPWEDVQATTTPELLRDSGPTLPPAGVVPAEAEVMVAGVDVQAGEGGMGHIYYVIRAWGPNMQSWLIDHGIVWAVTRQGEDEIDALSRFHDEILLRAFPVAENATTMSAVMCAVDSGYRTEDVYDWCAAHPGCLPAKGFDKHMAWGRYAKATAAVALTPGVKIIHRPLRVDVDTFACKAALYRWSRPSDAGPRLLRLNAEAVHDSVYLKQFSAEHLVIERGQSKWKTKTENRPNHYLDAEVCGLAAAELAGALVLEEGTVVHGDEAAVTEEAEEMSPGRTPMGRRLW